MGWAGWRGSLLAASVALSACGPGALPEGHSDLSQEPYDQAREEIIRKVGAGTAWKYQGLLPTLVDAQIVVSLQGHTVRVTGRLPAGWDKPLPFYAVKDVDSLGRQVVHVVYPIATGDLTGFNDNGSPIRNIEPGLYPSSYDYQPRLTARIYRPSDEKTTWGGFPYVEYVHYHREPDGRVRGGIAMHGPITAATHEGAVYWQLRRGPVSHG